MKKFYICIVMILFLILICIVWSAISLEKTNAHLEHWDHIIKEAENG